MSATERSRRLREARRDAGLVARTHWIHPDDAEALQHFVWQLAQRRELKEDRGARAQQDGTGE